MRAVVIPSLRSFASIAALFAFLLTSAFQAAAQTCPTVSFPPAPPVKIAVNPSTGKVYTVNESANTVDVRYPAGGPVVTLPVGPRPYFIAVNPVTNKVYVNTAGDSSVTVLDGASDTVVATLPLGTLGPIQVNPLTNTIYILRMTGPGTDEVSFINGATNEYYTIATESFQPIAVAVNPVTDKIYVAHYATGDVRAISGAFSGNAHPLTTSIGTGCKPFAIAANPVTNRIYELSSYAAGQIGVIDGATNGIVFPTVASGHAVDPKAITINPVTNKIYALFANEVIVIDGATNALTYVPVDTGSGFAAIVANPQANTVFIANDSGTLSILDGATNTVTTSAIPAGTNALSIVPFANAAYTWGTVLTTTSGTGAADAPVPITTAITPFAGNTTTPNPTFTFNASSTFGIPVSRVYYQLDGTSGAWTQASGSGPFTGSATGLSTGTHTVHAYGVDGQDAPLHTGSTGFVLGRIASYTFTVSTGSLATATVSLASSQNPSASGASVTFTATVSGSAGTPTGTVDFRADGVSIAGCSAVALATGSAACTATFTTGSRSITANYSGSSAYSPATGGPITQQTNAATVAPTVAVTSSANPSNAGQSVVFTATVSGSAGTPTGNVEFRDGATAIAACSGALNASGTRTCTTASLSAGSHSITVFYAGNSAYASGTSPVLTQTVNPGMTFPNVELSSSPNPSASGQAVTFTATVSGTAGAGTGVVDFMEGSAVLAGCSARPISGGTATCTTSALSVGDHSIHATYQGDANYNPANSFPVTQTVSAPLANAGIALSSSMNPAPPATNVTFTASLSGTAGAVTGTVDFLDGATALCSAVAISGGSASCSTSSLATGSHSITAQYSGNTAYNPGTSEALTQVIQPAPEPSHSINVALAGSGGVATGSSQWNANFPASATINGDRSGRGYAAGGVWQDGTYAAYPDWLQVAFNGNKTIDKVVVVSVQDNNTAPVEPTDTMTFSRYGVTDFQVQVWNGSSWATVATVNGNRLVKRTIMITPVTTSGIRILVTGALGNSSRLAEVEAWTVDGGAPPPPADATVALVSSPNPSSSGANVTFTATVSGSAGAVAGSVTFRDGAATIAGCVAVPVSSGAASCSTAALGVGSHSITASYSGSSAYNPATSNTVTQVVNSSTTTASVALASSLNPSTVGQAVTFTATLSGGSGTPTGTVTFYDGAAIISGCASVAASGGTAGCTTSLLTMGTHSITAQYSGNSSYGPATSAALSQSVTGTVSVNMALATNGTVATASSQWNANFPARALNNGERAGATYGAGGTWQDSTGNVYPDWVTLQFSSTQTIDRVVVFSMQDNYTSPSEPTDTMTFANYGASDFAVQAWNGSAWVTVATVTGNRLVKRTVAFPAVTTSAIRVSITRAMNVYSRLAEIEAWTPRPATPAPGGTNVALAEMGSVATASSTWNANYPAMATINGDRAGQNFGSGGTWGDATPTYPDWLQIVFDASEPLERVVVYSLQDNYTAPVEPTDTMIFTRLGVTDFTVQAWDGSAWVTVGTVTGNSLVKRTVTFASPVVTDRIRISIANSAGGYSRLAEVEAWTAD